MIASNSNLKTRYVLLIFIIFSLIINLFILNTVHKRDANIVFSKSLPGVTLSIQNWIETGFTNKLGFSLAAFKICSILLVILINLPFVVALPLAAVGLVAIVLLLGPCSVVYKLCTTRNITKINVKSKDLLTF